MGLCGYDHWLPEGPTTHWLKGYSSRAPVCVACHRVLGCSPPASLMSHWVPAKNSPKGHRLKVFSYRGINRKRVDDTHFLQHNAKRPH
ncbi:hypothetical protein FKM82_030029 [Ascaphus truei]